MQEAPFNFVPRGVVGHCLLYRFWVMCSESEHSSSGDVPLHTIKKHWRIGDKNHRAEQQKNTVKKKGCSCRGKPVPGQTKNSKNFTRVIVLDIFFNIPSTNPFNHPYSASCATAARSGPCLIQSDSSKVCTPVFAMILKTLVWFLSVGRLIASSL